MRPFFHQEKTRLWKTLKTIQTNPDYYISRGQTAGVNLLLHGHGGTGKSSLIYRIAQCFQRNIVSLDLRALTKKRAYQIIQRPHSDDYRKYIILFEEFDISIKELYLREQHTNEDKKYDELLDLVKKGAETISTSYKKDDDLKLRDLLEIFQGPVPFEQMIIIATTNRYDEIKEMCPELFRPGRLTPVHFDYINRETLQELSQYYFGRKIESYLPDMLNIPTSLIVELAFEALNNADSHVYFVKKLNDAINDAMK
jgi:SpoVK/Ycf46/Vps4 family AAA+-type ATPase